LRLDCAARSLLGYFLFVKDTLAHHLRRKHRPGRGGTKPYLRDTLLVLSSEEDGPGDTARVLALQEQRLGFAILESEDLAIATDVELALYTKPSAFCSPISLRALLILRRSPPSLIHSFIVSSATELGSLRTFPG
jgi:hypothetical protein